MTVNELYKKLGEILEKGEVRESSPVWFIGGDDELVSVENLEIDNDGDIILTMWTKEGLYKSKRMV
ncbi:hypothetical protein vipetofem_50 [Enterococcus phage vipetofem]|uniref:Uncharacterized protein n=1 Tax=Enterococcus phage vipetofem TaxID=2719594 RepID=A0A6G9LLF0_9CAUD|nr:hypothetical protein KNU92_gp090 [Enterococcus phage vipetofem]QIQ66348.1 hypothetical protein vipetofem_50 [Enterococcus phage vipetofem]